MTEIIFDIILLTLALIGLFCIINEIDKFVFKRKSRCRILSIVKFNQKEANKNLILSKIIQSCPFQCSIAVFENELDHEDLNRFEKDKIDTPNILSETNISETISDFQTSSL